MATFGLIRPVRLPTEEELNIRMPDIGLQDQLIEVYFTHAHPCFPIINKQQFMEEYNEKYHGSPGSDNSRGQTPASAQASRCLLLAIFALASRYIDQPPALHNNQMWESGCDYAIDAREVLNKIYHHSRLSTCQALLLLGVYECGIGSMEHSWLFIGMACRMAEDLGLNRNADKWSYGGNELFTSIEKQIRKQVWWGCVLLDKYISVYMGRPIAINRADFDTPLMELSEAEEDNWRPLPQDPQFNAHYPGVPVRAMSCFRASCMLSLIIGDIMKKIYPVRSMYSRRTELTKLETKLDQWYIDLAEQLRYDTTSKRTTPPPNILLLHVRYWSAVLLLHRAFIPKRKGAHLESDTVLLKSFDLCQTAASHISAIATAWNTDIGLRTGSPFLPPYLLSAGIMHIVTLTLRPGNVQASLGLRQSLAALKEMEVPWASASRAWDLLNGARVQYEGVITPLMEGSSGQRGPKRGAEDAFGRETSSELLQREAFDALQKHPSPPPAIAGGGQDMGTRMMAHMLGLDIPGIEPSTSYFPGYEWWPQARSGPPPPQQQQQRPPQANGNYQMPDGTRGLPSVQDWMMHGYSFDPSHQPQM